MRLKKKILHLVLSFLSIFLCFFPKKHHRVTFVSLTTTRMQSDFRRIADELKKDEQVEIYTILTKYKKNISGNILYFFNCIKQLFIINTSKVVIINDNNYVVSEFKKAFPTVIQIWHASGAVKKFGNEIKREYQIHNYDYVISTADAWQQIYARSFGVGADRVLPLGMARTDDLCRTEKVKELKRRFLKKYPFCKDHYLVLYAPTFRGNIVEGMTCIPIDLDSIIKQLPENYILLYKMHPLLGDINMGSDQRVVNVNHDNLYDLLAASDCLVTDYSSIIFDYSLLMKKQVYYIPDIREYKDDIGVNLNFKEMPGAICVTEGELIDELRQIDHFDKQKIEEFKMRYFAHQDGMSTLRIVRFIKELLHE